MLGGTVFSPLHAPVAGAHAAPSRVRPLATFRDLPTSAAASVALSASNWRFSRGSTEFEQSSFTKLRPVVRVLQVLNLCMGAHSMLTWYHEKFEDYPSRRKAVIPYVY